MGDRQVLKTKNKKLFYASLFHNDVSTQCGVNKHNEDYAGSGKTETIWLTVGETSAYVILTLSNFRHYFKSIFCLLDTAFLFRRKKMGYF